MFYVCKDDIIYPQSYATLDAARHAAEDMKNDQRAFLMAKKKIARLFGKGVPLNLSTYRIVTVAEVYHDAEKKSF